MGVGSREWTLGHQVLGTWFNSLQFGLPYRSFFDVKKSLYSSLEHIELYLINQLP